jgi:transcriptional regulator with XRE-family HTH domain
MGTSEGMEDAGQELKKLRERLGLRFRDVEQASLSIAQRHRNDEFLIALSRLSDIENKGSVPSIYRLYSLCAIYRLDFVEALAWFGVDLSKIATDRGACSSESTHVTSLPAAGEGSVELPVALDPGMDPRCTTFLTRMIERWGSAPLGRIRDFDRDRYLYGYIGTEDWSMYPVLTPGALVVVDPTHRELTTGAWRNEYERPIYFVEHAEGFVCGWCSLDENHNLIVQAHPGSGKAPAVFRYPEEAEVIGQVTASAMSLTPGPPPRTHS